MFRLLTGTRGAHRTDPLAWQCRIEQQCTGAVLQEPACFRQLPPHALPVKTNPTVSLSAFEFAAVERPSHLRDMDESQLRTALSVAEERGFAMARRLGMERDDHRLPAYIWAIIFSAALTNS